MFPLIRHSDYWVLTGLIIGGVVGYARTSYDGKSPVVGFDMGGTSTDVSRFGGSLEHVFESTTAGVSIQCPQLDINTVAAGGGSMLFWRDGLFKVGPEVSVPLTWHKVLRWKTMFLTRSPSRVPERIPAPLLTEKEDRWPLLTRTSCESAWN